MKRILFYCYLVIPGFSFAQNLTLRDFPDDRVMVIAHRADWREAPENSLWAIRKAIEKGVHMVELDVAMTRDSVLILLHDNTLDRATTGKGAPGRFTYAELQAFYLRDGLGVPTRMKIPTLKEAFEVSRGKVLVNVDRAYTYFDEIYRLADSMKMTDQVLFKGSVSFSEFNGRYGHLKGKIVFMPVVDITKAGARQVIEEYLAQYPGVYGFVYGFELILGENESALYDFSFIRKAGKKIWINSIWPRLAAGHSDDDVLEDPDAYKWFIDQGANMIQTDRPLELLHYLQRE